MAIEIKSCDEIKLRHTKGLKAFAEDFPEAKLIAVSHDLRRRTMNGVEIYPVTDFLKALWRDEIIKAL